MITLFLFLTAPITGHFVAKTHLHLLYKPRDLPPRERAALGRLRPGLLRPRPRRIGEDKREQG